MRSYFIIFFSVFSIFSAHCQSNQEITSFVSAAQSDINTIGAEYFNPLFKSVQLSMSEGWVQSAKPHKKFGFNFTFFGSAINIPKANRSFVVPDLNIITPTQSESSTFFGGESSNVYNINYLTEDENISLSSSFIAPEGLDEILVYDRLIIPNFQFSTALFFKTDLMIRLTPELNIQGAKFKSFGGGLKHSLTQHAGFLKTLPFKFSSVISFTKINASYNLDKVSNIDGDNQEIILDAKNISAGLIFSKSFKIIDLYASILFSQSSSSLSINGSYLFSYDSSSETENAEYTLNNPFTFSSDLNYIKKNIGIVFNFPVIKLFVDYSIQNYNSINAGVSIGVL